MKNHIKFEKHQQQSTIHNPVLDNALDTQNIEVRRDPLTGSQSVYSDQLKEKIKAFVGPSDYELIEQLAANSETTCFLCGDKWKKTTPTYPESVVPSGRVHVEEAVLFPNLFPVSQVHAVIRVGSRHYLPLDEFRPQTVQDAFTAALDFASAMNRADSTVKFLTISGNYLGPAGASIAHPHFQVVGGDIPSTYQEQQIAHLKRYYDEAHSCYLCDLVEEEPELYERHIGTTGQIDWITSFSPQGTNEVLGILGKRRHFLELEKKEIEELAVGFSHVLHAYHSMGISTFNFAFYSGPLGVQDETFRCYVRIISRQNVYRNYRTDDFFLQKLLRNELILTPPEALAQTMRESFETE